MPLHLHNSGFCWTHFRTTTVWCTAYSQISQQYIVISLIWCSWVRYYHLLIFILQKFMNIEGTYWLNKNLLSSWAHHSRYTFVTPFNNTSIIFRVSLISFSTYSTMKSSILSIRTDLQLNSCDRRSSSLMQTHNFSCVLLLIIPIKTTL